MPVGLKFDRAGGTSSVFSYYAIRVVAMVTMLVDHVGATFFQREPILAATGRAAYPLYAFCIACGWLYTRNRRRYLLMLALVAVLSQVFATWDGCNVIFGFLASLAWLLWTTSRFARGQNKVLVVVLAATTWLATATIGILLNFEYALESLVLVPSFYLVLSQQNTKSTWLASIVAAVYGLISPWFYSIPFYSWGGYALAAALILLHKDGKMSPNKWFHGVYFWFYPAHLAVLWLATMITTVQAQ